MSPAQAQHAASMVPSTFIEGGLWDDLDMEISDIAWGRFNFAKEGAPQNLKLALIVEFCPLTGLEPGQSLADFQQAYSAGDLKYFVPSADDEGAYAIPVGGKQGLNSNTNSGFFLTSLFECATPEQRAWLEEALAPGNCKVLKGAGDGTCGLQLHIKRQPQKERKGLSAQEGDSGPKTVLLATNLIALPGETATVVSEVTAGAAVAPAPVKPKAPPKPAAAPAPARPAATAAPARPAPAPAPASAHAAGGKVNGAAVAARPAVARPGVAAGKAAPTTATPVADSWDAARMNEAGYQALLEILGANPEGVVEFSEVPKQAFRSEALRAVPVKTRQTICAIMYDEGWLSAQEGIVYDQGTQTVTVAA